MDDLPFIPVMAGALWYTYSTKHFTGFPNQKNNYANGSTYLYPDDVKILTSLRPLQ